MLSIVSSRIVTFWFRVFSSLFLERLLSGCVFLVNYLVGCVLVPFLPVYFGVEGPMKYPFLFGDPGAPCLHVPQWVWCLVMLYNISVIAVLSDCKATQDLGIEVTVMQSRTNS
jgi:hypothetical protein